jgi:hypothetical protein
VGNAAQGPPQSVDLHGEQVVVDRPGQLAFLVTFREDVPYTCCQLLLGGAAGLVDVGQTGGD